jgi:hypothetical protein
MVMFEYNITILKVSGVLTESTTPKESFVVKSKKVLSEQEAFDKVSEYLKEKYNLVLEQAAIDSPIVYEMVDGEQIVINGHNNPSDIYGKEREIADAHGPSWIKRGGYIEEADIDFANKYVQLETLEKEVFDGWAEVCGEDVTDYDFEQVLEMANDNWRGKDEWKNFVIDTVQESNGEMNANDVQIYFTQAKNGNIYYTYG